MNLISNRTCWWYMLIFVAFLTMMATTNARPEPQQYDDEDNGNFEDENINVAINIPDFISKDESKKVKLGSLLTLRCRLDGDIGQVPLMWVKLGSSQETGEKESYLALNGNKMPPVNSRLEIRTMDDGEILTLRNFAEEDSGVYECKIMANPPKGVKFNVTVGEPEDDEEDDIDTFHGHDYEESNVIPKKEHSENYDDNEGEDEVEDESDVAAAGNKVSDSDGNNAQINGASLLLLISASLAIGNFLA